jgi:pimeloyl-ACP methyl ester carboxylesterase
MFASIFLACDRKRLWSGPYLVPGDEPVGDIVEVVADDLRLRTDSQNIVAGTLDQRCLPARRDGAQGIPCVTSDKAELRGLDRKLFLDVGVSLARGLVVLHAIRGESPLEQAGNAAMLKLALRAFLAPEATRWQYTHGVPDPTMVSPDGQNLDNFYLARPGADEVQLDLFGDYKSNVALYPSFQEYFRTHKPPLLAAWGNNDPFFVPAGAEAFRRDNPGAVVRFFDTGHFALETHAREIAESIRDFLR